MKRLLLTCLLLPWLTACSVLPWSSEDADEGVTPEKPLTILVINDVYRLDNLPYVRHLRASLEQSEGEVLMLHAGDFLFPSLLSQRYDGEQMVDVLNYLDGDGAAFDEHMFITFGNHEFEKGKLKHAPLLQSRITESQFAWLGTNVEFKSIEPGRQMVQADNLLPSKLITLNGVKVGVLSATTDVKGADYIRRFIPPMQAVRTTSRALRQQGAQVVIALTHLTLKEDRALLEQLGDDAPDLIAGGHEHDRQSVQVNGRRIVKADADAMSAAVVRLDAANPKQSSVTFVDLPGKYAPDAGVVARINQWDARFAEGFCGEKGESNACLTQVLGKTAVDLIAEELTIRRFETNLGNWLADTARTSFADQGAQIAFLNAGGMRLNQNIPAGELNRRHLDTLFAYPTRLAMIRLSGAQLQAVVNHAITDWTGNGRWLQVSGFAFKHNPATGTAEQLSLITPQGLRPIQADETLLAVTNDYLLDASGDQDGYRMLGENLIVALDQPRLELKDKVLEALQQAGSAGIAPRVEGRVCNASKPGVCLLK
ncbi:5'-nucleotidase C-terminal domain-containing protein [Thiothrix unzii]|jgi:2',3'-cyclic-nucleotide 2'-phosphodiesterase (5'-nucleotidase family)|uniref:bifunctional metallophosphatase/5'-nucleotidase n=1 Tax=Thiothrix unzii TaxID=111769 RepID=UPI002A36F647|nr:5'-nucleotidase C-terminal domain-containing protein [Thiothrix unzii]MDX9988359.1 5'-nucleotidase C-terminal domain-containing protein [Thiothrix unzii]